MEKEREGEGDCISGKNDIKGIEEISILIPKGMSNCFRNMVRKFLLTINMRNLVSQRAKDSVHVANTTKVKRQMQYLHLASKEVSPLSRL